MLQSGILPAGPGLAHSDRGTQARHGEEEGVQVASGATPQEKFSRRRTEESSEKGVTIVVEWLTNSVRATSNGLLRVKKSERRLSHNIFLVTMIGCFLLSTFLLFSVRSAEVKTVGALWEVPVPRFLTRSGL